MQFSNYFHLANIDQAAVVVLFFHFSQFKFYAPYFGSYEIVESC
jgi:hypothetical protein